ncbi:hypothetical protein E3O05_25135, partial [Escherichia coli]
MRLAAVTDGDRFGSRENILLETGVECDVVFHCVSPKITAHHKPDGAQALSARIPTRIKSDARSRN